MTGDLKRDVVYVLLSSVIGLLVLISGFFVAKWINRKDDKLDGMDGKFNKLHTKMDTLKTGMDSAHTTMSSKVDGVKDSVNARIDSFKGEVGTKIDNLKEQLNKRATRIDVMDQKIKHNKELADRDNEQNQKDIESLSTSVRKCATEVGKLGRIIVVENKKTTILKPDGSDDSG